MQWITYASQHCETYFIGFRWGAFRVRPATVQEALSWRKTFRCRKEDTKRPPEGALRVVHVQGLGPRLEKPDRTNLRGWEPKGLSASIKSRRLRLQHTVHDVECSGESCRRCVRRPRWAHICWCTDEVVAYVDAKWRICKMVRPSGYGEDCDWQW